MGNVADIAEGATSGTHSAAFSAGGDSEGDMLSQSFFTDINQVYMVDFDAGIYGPPDNGANLQLRVQVIGNSTLLDETITLPRTEARIPINSVSALSLHFYRR